MRAATAGASQFMNRDLSAATARTSEPSFYYDLFGLAFASPVAIPGMDGTASPTREGAIQIQFGRTPDALADVAYEDETVQASATEYLFTYPGVLRLYVGGDQVIVAEQLAGCDPVRLWTVILGVGSSIAGLRRGHIPLHASSVLVNDGCLAFGGQSGAGKSTIAASLVKRGFELFADDLCLVQDAVSGQPTVGHGVAELRLLDDAVTALDWSSITPFAIQPHTTKSVFRREPANQRRAPLRRVYALQFADEGTGVHRLNGVEAMQALTGCLRLRFGLLPIGDAAGTFRQIAAIAESVEIYRFVRPRDHAQAGLWLDRLIDHFQQ